MSDNEREEQSDIAVETQTATEDTRATQLELGVMQQSSNTLLHSALSPPEKFELTGDIHKNWTLWKQQWDDFQLASGLSTLQGEAGNKKRAAFLRTALGRPVLEILNSLNLTDTERDNPEGIIKKLDIQFKPKVNLAYERLLFNRRCQRNGESVDDFVNDLRKLVKSCNYGCKQCQIGSESQMIADRIICGVADDRLRQTLLSQEDQSLDKVISIAKAVEQSRKQVRDIETHRTDSIDASVRAYNVVQPKKLATSNSTQKCGNCSREHIKGNCPAVGKNCNKCGKIGHFANACRSSKANRTGKSIYKTNNKPSVNTFVISQIETPNAEEECQICLTVEGGQNVNFKVDTGADVNVISKQLAKKLDAKIYRTPVKTLIAFNGAAVQTAGQCFLKASATNNIEPISLKCIVLRENCKPILGRSDAIKYGFVKICCAAEYNQEEKHLLETFKDLFDINKIGKITGTEYNIELTENATSVHRPPRKVPIALREEVKKTLDDMVTLGVLRKVNEPTKFVSQMSVVKQGNKIRICIDPSDLNRAVLRRHHPLRTFEDVATQLTGSKCFRKYDLFKGFWQIPLGEASQLLTTFITPWGRYCATRLPFGVKSAPEVFQETMDEVIEGLEGVVCSCDDVIVHAEDIETLNIRTRKLFERFRKRGIKLNPDKCQHKASTQITFLGHQVTDQGVLPDTKKIENLKNFKTPNDVTSLKRFLGFAQYLSKFVKNFSELAAPLYELTKKDNFHWKGEHTQVFEMLKEAIQNTSTLRYFDPNKSVTLQVDASSKTVGAALLQDGAPVAFKSAMLTKSQQKWSQIEKEALAIKFGCEKFHEFIYGCKDLRIETDHKPLEQIFKKPLSAAPPRLQHIMYRLQPYGAALIHIKGKNLQFADFLTRDVDPDEYTDEHLYVQTIEYPTDVDLKEIETNTCEDSETALLYCTIRDGWPENNKNLNRLLKPYWQYRDQLSIHDNKILFQERFVIPPSLRQKYLKQLHRTHQGIEATSRLAREYLFWPGMHRDIEHITQFCDTCSKNRRNNSREPTQSHPIPDRPWKYLSTDIFKFDSSYYLVLTDSYSGYLVAEKLKNIEPTTVIDILKQNFYTHGLPDVIMSDCGTQFTSFEFKNFAKEFKFRHVTSSPEYPQSNGLAERAVQTAKNLLKKSVENGREFKEAIFMYNNTPQPKLGSPSQRLFGRRCKTFIPANNSLLNPLIIQDVPENLKKRREEAAKYADRHAKPLHALQEGTTVWFKTQGRGPFRAVIRQQLRTGRSYSLEAENGRSYIRNRRQLQVCPEVRNEVSNSDSSDEYSDAREITEDGVTQHNEITNEAEDIIPEVESQITSTEELQPIQRRECRQGVPVIRSRRGRIIKPTQRLDL